MNERYKRFMVFAMEEREPSGGLDDCQGSFSTLSEVQGALLGLQPKYFEFYVFDRTEGLRYEVKFSTKVKLSDLVTIVKPS